MSALFSRLFVRGLVLCVLVALVSSCVRDRRIGENFSVEPEAWIGGPAKLGHKVTVVDFWATWCEPCLRAMPELIEWQRKYGAQGLQVYGVAGAEMDTTPDTLRPTLEKFLASHFPELNFPIACDSTGAIDQKWKIEALPTQFVLSATGQIVFIGRGPEVEEAVRRQLAMP